MRAKFQVAFIGKITVLIFAFCLYLTTFTVSPALTWKCVTISLKEMKKLLIPFIVALFLGTLVKNLITPVLISRFLRGMKGIFSAAVIGSILPPCPFIAYPVIKGINDGGAPLYVTMIMLITATTVEIGQIFCGLIIFGPKIVGIRISFAFLSSLIISLIYSSAIRWR